MIIFPAPYFCSSVSHGTLIILQYATIKTLPKGCHCYIFLRIYIFTIFHSSLADLVKLTVEILDGKLHFCAVSFIDEVKLKWMCLCQTWINVFMSYCCPNVESSVFWTLSYNVFLWWTEADLGLLQHPRWSALW